MNARTEAFERLGGAYDVRVLEPSPPAVAEPPWFADDPVARGEVPPGRRLVSPVTTGDLLWDDLAREDASLAAWCAERWLGAWPRLGTPPRTLPETRAVLHELAERVIAPARERATGKIGLRYTRGGFGTPFFGEDEQLRVEGVELVRQRGGEERREPIAGVDPDAARFLGDLYGFAASVLEQLRAEVDVAAHDPSRVQLWPEHFDLAVELGVEARGARAAYGVSPGDDAHHEPYVYVAPWAEPVAGELWNAASFAGAELAWSDVVAADDQREFVLDFLRARFAALTS